MNATRQTLARNICAMLFGVLVLHSAAADEPFNQNELKQFLTNCAPFLEWVRTNGHERVLERLMENPKFVTEFPEAVRLLRDHSWQPERFAYILNHVIVACKRLGMDKEPSQLLARLEETKVAVQKDLTQSEAEKARTLAIVAEAQREVRKTDKAFAELPTEEVRLLWIHRAELHRALDGRLPMGKRVLPNPSRKP